MTVRKRRSDRSGRGALPSPGRPSVARREDHRQFWAAIAAGRSSEDAAVGAGVSPAVGARWFRRAGGMPPSHLAPAAKPLSGRSLSFAEREEIAIWRAQRHGVREIARRLKRAPSTISRELRRNAATRSGGLAYRATTAQWHADRSARRPKSAKLAINEPLRRYVQDRLAGMVVAPNGAAVHGPIVPWKGRRHGRRQDRRWATAWSPEQIARRLRLDFPDDETMRISQRSHLPSAVRAKPGSAEAPDDVTTSLLRERIDGRSLSDEEIVSIVRNWTVGELGTIAASIGILVHYLAERLPLQRELREKPSLLPAAIDETLRIHAPLIANRRVTTRAVEIGGRALEAGARLGLIWASANRDEAVFGDPDEFRLDRDPSDNLLYGAGIHICPGAPLARLELRTVLEELFKRSREITLADGKPAIRARYPASGFSRLPARIR